MTNAIVTVRRSPDAEVEHHQIRINGGAPNFLIGTERISDWAVAAVEPRLLDLLDIAATVFATDRKIPRGGTSRPEFGRGWRRRFDFAIEVRDHAFWSDREIRDCLGRTISFLTGDDAIFDFHATSSASDQGDYLDFIDGDGDAGGDHHVVLFSGGLDSLAGALETLTQETGRVVLVTHQSAPKIISHQNRLAAALRSRFAGRVFHVPVRAHLVRERSRDTTQRSRSFLFAAFGYVIASIVGAGRMNFFENGVVSQNLPISPQVIGTMATRTTHPLTLQLFEELFGHIRGQPFLVRNRFEWLTKADIVSRIRDLGAGDLIADTVTCNQVLERSATKTHCGACTQCLDRRFGILAAGMGDADPEEIYEIPVLAGARSTAREITIAQEWIRHASRLAKMTPTGFLERFGPEVSRIRRGHPDLGGGETLRRSFELQQRHGRNVERVLSDAVGANANALIAGALPETSLLRVAVADKTGGLDIVRIDEAKAEPPGEGSATRSPIATDTEPTLLVHLRETEGGKLVEVSGLGCVQGMSAAPVFALLTNHRASPMSFALAGSLTPAAGPTKEAVTANIKRCRDKLAEFHQAVHGKPPAAPILVQNRRNLGYRLDPDCVVTGPDGSDPSI